MKQRLIHLVDDEESVRRSAAFLLRTSGFHVLCYASGVEFLKEVRHAAPGCILLDVRMPDVDGLQVQRELHVRGVDWPVIILTGHGDVAIAVSAMKEGATDFVEKPFEKATLLTAIESGFRYLGGKQTAEAAAAASRIRIAGLTPREREVLAGLTMGHPNKTIAYDLGISPRTVEVHRANLMTKLQVRSLSDALRLAFAAGMDKGPGAGSELDQTMVRGETA